MTPRPDLSAPTAGTGRLVPITKAEARALADAATHDEPLPIVFSAGRVAIVVTGDGSAEWALLALTKLRAVPR
jgi:hypothetical protein